VSLADALPQLLQSGETGLLQLLHALGLAQDVHGQPAWPFARRIATETLALDAGLARQLAWALAGLVLALLLGALGAARRRARTAAWSVAALVLLALPWPDTTLVLGAAQATSFHRSPIDFDARAIAAGRTLYDVHCASCHGADGRGEGPRAASLPTWPPRLDGALLGRRAEGEVFATILHGMHGRDGTPTMPGVDGRLADAQVWSLMAAMKALAAGAAVRAEAAWAEPVRAPDALVHCDDGAPDRALRRFQGQRLRIVAAGGAGPAPTEDPRLVTIVLRPADAPDAAGATGQAGCSIADSAAWAAYAEVGGVAPRRLAGAQFIVDRDGWLRAYAGPGRAGWSQDDFVCRSARPERRAAPGRDGLGDLIAAIDADPIRRGALGFAHRP